MKDAVDFFFLWFCPVFVMAIMILGFVAVVALAIHKWKEYDNNQKIGGFQYEYFTRNIH